MEILVPISVGELVDKITILKIKKSKIKDEQKNSNISLELSKLTQVCSDKSINLDHPEVHGLLKINQTLWDIEDRIREKESLKEFDSEFIELARSVYISNDKRFELKKAINKRIGSSLVEEKSYTKYL